jgi:hypothetical protein
LTSRATGASRRQIIARTNAHLRWAFEPDRSAATAAARQAFQDRFEVFVDPDGALEPTERAKRAKNLRSAHYALMGLRSGEAHRARAGQKKATS